ncbi:DUF5131 family protein [Streptomyces actuosus]|uniref:DUF5131 family protein n=1 Tax=Streptomyces actuosus TaxID=1885 RepID=UPI0034D70D47
MVGCTGGAIGISVSPGSRRRRSAVGAITRTYLRHRVCRLCCRTRGWGVPAESQRWAKVRLPLLAETPAAVGFAGCEPLLGALDIRPWPAGGPDRVIVGGESGPRARPMDPRWARSMRDQCVAADVWLFSSSGVCGRLPALSPLSTGPSKVPS